MDLTALIAISPIDGRYKSQLQHLDQYFSEYALMRYRLIVEIEYLIKLGRKQFFKLKPGAVRTLRTIYRNFSIEKAVEIKEIERTTNHDVKAVEYYIRKELEQLQLPELKEWVHFGLTSQDINNTAIPLLWKEVIENEYYPALTTLILQLKRMAKGWKNIPMLARTHGQPATPTRLGKEFMVFIERMEQQLQLLQVIPNSCKFGGATGNLNAHYAAFPKTNWIKFANDFCSQSLGLQRQQFTTQIEHYDGLSAQFDTIKRLNNILIDFCRDVWTYISMEYFRQKIKKGEVGSSAMPHKVNPIDFENAEGNLGIANAFWEHLSSKLPVSRLQRDLTDSTVLRNLGVPFGHTILAFKSIEKGLGKLLLNEHKIKQDLEQNWAVIAEAIQTILRRENYPNPYEALKDLTRGAKHIDAKAIHAFITKLKVSDGIKKELKAITPFNYTGKNPEF